ncbi:MAG: hypothetical protein GX748_15180 [Lentisphaerae bacterium]|jgi:hypothetical protein|nr:hypothetical protein [Lentisphaerota bacterium]
MSEVNRTTVGCHENRSRIWRLVETHCAVYLFFAVFGFNHGNNRFSWLVVFKLALGQFVLVYCPFRGDELIGAMFWMFVVCVLSYLYVKRGGFLLFISIFVFAFVWYLPAAMLLFGGA